MKKIISLSICLILGLVASQSFPYLFGEIYLALKSEMTFGMLVCLAFIMINVGREFKLDKSLWRNYVSDYFIAMLTAAAPWIFVSLYFMLLLPSEYMGNIEAWKENLLLGRFAAPTSAGILFTMLAAAGLKKMWIYSKTQTLAIFDDLDTILLMIPLQAMMIGMKWQLAVVLIFVFAVLYFGWVKLGKYSFKQSPAMIILYSVAIVVIIDIIYLSTKHLFGIDGAIHLEVLLPAYVLGMVMKTTSHYPENLDNSHNSRIRKRTLIFIKKMTRSNDEENMEQVSSIISYLFMFLVGTSTPVFIGSLVATGDASSINASQAMMSPGQIALHVLVVTLISNIGKMFPILFYRDRHILERLALSIGMFTRGEVGAGIIIIALGYNIGGSALIIAVLSLVLNLILTGGFVILVRNLSQRVYKNDVISNLKQYD